MVLVSPLGLVTTAPVLHRASDELEVPAAVCPVSLLSKCQMGIVLQSPHDLPDFLGGAVPPHHVGHNLNIEQCINQWKCFEESFCF